MSDERTNGIGWFLAGLGLGAVTAILYAPKAGRETREAIVARVDDGRKHLSSLGRNAREQVSDWVASGKEIFAGKKRQVNAAIDAGSDALHLEKSS